MYASAVFGKLNMDKNNKAIVSESRQVLVTFAVLRPVSGRIVPATEATQTKGATVKHLMVAHVSEAPSRAYGPLDAVL